MKRIKREFVRGINIIIIPKGLFKSIRDDLILKLFKYNCTTLLPGDSAICYISHELDIRHCICKLLPKYIIIDSTTCDNNTEIVKMSRYFQRSYNDIANSNIKIVFIAIDKDHTSPNTSGLPTTLLFLSKGIFKFSKVNNLYEKIKSTNYHSLNMWYKV